MVAAGPDNCIITWHIDSQQAWSELVVSPCFCGRQGNPGGRGDTLESSRFAAHG